MPPTSRIGNPAMTSNTRVPPGANDAAVRAELVRALYESVAVPLMNLVVVAISAVVLWPIFPAWIVLAWTGAAIAVAVFRLALWLGFKRRQQDAGALGSWAVAFTLASATMGCLWGLLASTVFVSPDLIYTVFAAFVLGGVSAAAATHNSPHLPAYFGFTTPTALPMIVALLTRGGAMQIGMGLMVLAFVAVLTVVARDNNRRLVEYIRMKIEQGVLNDDLRRREHDQTEIAKLNDLLQACVTTTEAYPIVAATAESLFPQASGSLARAERGTHDLTRVAAWGPDQMMLADFLTEDCWALRTGQRREVEGPGSAVQCRHFSRPPRGPYICMPLIVRGETSGLLSFGLREGGVIDDELRQTMQTFGDVVKLSLVNINQLELLGQQALRDHLTGLFNRRYLVETMPREVRRAQRSGSPLTVAMLDLDSFKKLNDEYGHDAGDKVLSELGLVLGQGLRPEDIACRYGGEEFVLVLPECDPATARARLQQICLAAKGKTLVFRGRTLPKITLSVGMATLSGALPTAESLITAADHAMYVAKSNGRDRIEDYQTPEAGGHGQALITEAPALPAKTA